MGDDPFLDVKACKVILVEVRYKIRPNFPSYQSKDETYPLSAVTPSPCFFLMQWFTVKINKPLTSAALPNAFASSITKYWTLQKLTGCYIATRSPIGSDERTLFSWHFRRFRQLSLKMKFRTFAVLNLVRHSLFHSRKALFVCEAPLALVNHQRAPLKAMLSVQTQRE